MLGLFYVEYIDISFIFMQSKNTTLLCSMFRMVYFFNKKVHHSFAYSKFLLYLCPLFCVLAKMSMVRNLWNNYRSEVLFGLILAVLIGASTYLSRFITDRVFDNILTPAMNVGTIAVAFVCAWIIYRHSEGMRMRRLWGYALLAWGLGDLAYLVCYLVAPLQVMNMGADRLTTYELLIGNLLGWVMVLYPTETLRPGWLTPKIVAWQLLPMIALVALDYIIPYSLWPVVALYPYALLILTLSHIRAYRIWCENNYSSMEHIDVQWIIRYCIMLFIIGANYVYMCSGHGHTRGFTQQWFVIFMLAYSTEQILFRKDPWAGLTSEGVKELTNEGEGASVCQSEGGQPDNVRLLEQWMEQQKPYLNPEFKLMDLRAVLPMNRTYLSQFINDTYGCPFYQWVNGLRIEEAKRLMTEQPEMTIEEVSKQCGFSYRRNFSRTFVEITGMTPSEWRSRGGYS